MAANENFDLVFERQIPELKGSVRFYRHTATGAEVLSLINEDDNKVFGVSFRTPPSDSTGIAHILEHSVLCGSRKYPVKEPFVELIKGSLKTFLNAFTYPDKTCYPVASQNVQDFYNLIDVYLDAVFHPRLTPFVLQQEGWHYELESPDAALSIKGVVYNEMKGAYSSPDSILSELSQQSLFPDTTYGLDSGGDPKVIPSLTWEKFKAFHDRLYHPSNARIYFYGNDNPDRRLDIIQEFLKDFDRTAPGSEVPPQQDKQTPLRVVRSFAAGEDGDSDPDGAKSMLTINWLLPEATDPVFNLAFQVLEYVLLGMPGSPLKKALIESGLGEDLAGIGLETELRRLYFSTGLKGIREEDADKVEKLIFDTLSNLAGDGIDPATIEAGVNTIEFRLRENNHGNYPQGLVLMLRALSTWLHDTDPTALLAFEGPLSEVKEKLKKGGFFEELIRRYLIENRHRTVVLLRPEPGLGEKETKEESRRLEEIKKSLRDDQVAEVIENARTLQRLQSTPDSEQALATIPVLKISDLERRNKLIPIEAGPVEGVLGFYHDLFTSGITYMDVGFNLQVLPQQYLSYAPIFGRALLEMGTELEDFVSLSQRISRKTGGIRPEVFTSAVNGGDEPATWLFLRGKSMAAQTGDLTGILAEVIGSARLYDRDRFRQIALAEKAKLERRMVPNGHQMVNQRIRAHFTQADWVRELTSGISYFHFLGGLIKQIDEDWDIVRSDLEQIRTLLARRSGMVFNVTADGKDLASIQPSLNSLLRTIPEGEAAINSWRPELFPEFEGITIPAQVNYVGKGANLYSNDYQFEGSSLVISGYLRSSWLWEKVRVLGGAYGGFCQFDRISGVFTFLSYRDPNLLKTVENFDGAAQFLRTADIGDDEVRKAVIGSIGDLDTYMLPDTKGLVSMLRYLTRDSEESRQKMREQVLATTSRDFRAFAEVLEGVNRDGIVKVLGSQGAIESALSERPGWLKTFRLL
ncbi:MAG: insulinase family protein [Syntrophobacteraceae bacterium]